VKIHLSDPVLLPDLLAYLRANGCLALHLEGAGVLVAEIPDLHGPDEDAAIVDLAVRWRCAHPWVAVGYSDS
jgi:hypothetical protein